MFIREKLMILLAILSHFKSLLLKIKNNVSKNKNNQLSVHP